MNPIQQLEVILHKQNNKYRATCPAFPHCSGKGETESEALKKLGNSIARFINKMTRDAIQSVLKSDAYTEVLLDMTHKDKEQRRIFNMKSLQSKLHKNMMFKVDVTSNKSAKRDVFPVDSLTQLIQKQKERVGNPFQDIDPKEGFVFGFPLSFN